MPRRILSVGYDHVSLTLRNWVLERAGYEVVSASSKLEALQFMQNEACDLIVIAGNLPQNDLMEVASANQSIPILWLFVGAREDVPGVTAYMPLLDGPEELLTKVRQLLAQSTPRKPARLHPFLGKQLRSKRQA